MTRWAWAEIDLGAIEHNVSTLRAAVAPSALWAVVKADGYGHGAVEVARAALRAGAAGLCVALVQEGLALRAAGIDAPVLVLSEQPPDELAAAVRAGLELTVYSVEQVAAIAAAGGRDHPVHLKLDTGMRRVGVDVTGGATEALRVAAAVAASPAVLLAGVSTHLAVADDPAHPDNLVQLDRFDEALADLRRAGHEPVHVHAANSAAALALPRARHSFVRAGIGIYGISPGHGVDGLASALRPALSLHARVSWVKPVPAGDGVSYGLAHRFARDTVVATVPIGYADGVPRRWSAIGGQVLVGGRRCPIVGVVTMDQIVVDCGDLPVSIGDPVVLIGRQGDEEITAAEWADRLGTIGYEVVCGLSARVPRHCL